MEMVLRTRLRRLELGLFVLLMCSLIFLLQLSYRCTNSPETHPESGEGTFSVDALGEPLRAMLDRRLRERERQFDWTNVPDCVRHHLRRYTVSHLLHEYSLLHVQRPKLSQAGWQRSDIGYGTQRLFLVSYEKFKPRQQQVLDQLRPYDLESSGMLMLWEEPHLDVAQINNDTAMISCFWPKREKYVVSKREMSLSLKHMTLYYYALLFGLLPASVIEDDIIVNPSLTHVWPSAVRSVPDGWALIQAGWCLSEKGLPPEYGEYLTTAKNRERHPLCTYSYLISSTGVMKAFQSMYIVSHVASMCDTEQCEFRSLQLCPRERHERSICS